MTRRCKGCNVWRKLNRFAKLPSGNYRGVCKDCRNSKETAAYAVDPVKRLQARDRHLRNRYGLTDSQMTEMIIEQGGCAICHKTTVKSWCADHDHQTGRLRGILCSGCNAGLGLLGDTAIMISRAVNYVTIGENVSPFVPC